LPLLFFSLCFSALSVVIAFDFSPVLRRLRGTF